MLINFYKCSSCTNQWADVYECAVDMTCSKCGQDNMSPYHSEELPTPKEEENEDE
tara:strand:- start:47 stop:211 length:165 start_codon:yes stop_codon:yes gene_type:complete